MKTGTQIKNIRTQQRLDKFRRFCLDEYSKGKISKEQMKQMLIFENALSGKIPNKELLEEKPIKKTRLSAQEKLEVISLFRQGGITPEQLAKKYGVYTYLIRYLITDINAVQLEAF